MSVFGDSDRRLAVNMRGAAYLGDRLEGNHPLSDDSD
jgi:hypothetical protein